MLQNHFYHGGVLFYVNVELKRTFRLSMNNGMLYTVVIIVLLRVANLFKTKFGFQLKGDGNGNLRN